MPKNREQLKQEYVNSLDSFISKNPKVGQLDTTKFRDFLIGLVEHESGFNPSAKQGSYFGWYQMKHLDADPYMQHMNAFNHLNDLFNNTITKEDITQARKLGINDSALMLKYWNQGNRVNNYIWNNKDSADGLGTKISEYGNDLTMPLDVYGYAMDNLYGDYIVKDGDRWFNIQKRVRIPGRDYATGGHDLWNMQKLSGRPFGSLKIGQSFNFGQQPAKKITDPVNVEFPEKFKHLFDLHNRIYNNKEFVINRYKEGGKTKNKINSLVYNYFDGQSKEEQSEDTSMIYKTPDLSFYDIFGEEYEPSYPVEPIREYIPYNNYKDFEETSETDDTDNKTSDEQAFTINKGVLEMADGITDVGNMQDLIDLMIDEGISFRITSGNRPGDVTSNGQPSHHGNGNALDITPIKGQTWDDLIAQMKRSNRFISYMKEHGLGILDERSKQMQIQTGATGPHFHIGPDKNAISNFETLFE